VPDEDASVETGNGCDEAGAWKVEDTSVFDRDPVMLVLCSEKLDVDPELLLNGFELEVVNGVAGNEEGIEGPTSLGPSRDKLLLENDDEYVVVESGGDRSMGNGIDRWRTMLRCSCT